jgi:hypothetical protein
MRVLTVAFLFMLSTSVFAESSKLTKVDIDVRATQIVKADLDIDDFYYYIDTNACICWLSNVIGGTSSITTVDCSKLAAHPKLEQYVNKCVGAPVEIKKETSPVVEKAPEVVATPERTSDKKETKKK